MPLNIKSAEADRLARELTAVTGESITDAVTVALAERLERCRVRRSGLKAVVGGIQERIARMPVIDNRPDDELLGYDRDGLPE